MIDFGALNINQQLPDHIFGQLGPQTEEEGPVITPPQK